MPSTAFVKWLLPDGYSIGTVNLRLSTVRAYAKLAATAGYISTEEYALIRMVQGYSINEGRHIDETRSQNAKVQRKLYQQLYNPLSSSNHNQIPTKARETRY